MSNINKKGIWTTSTFHELYGENITQLYGITNSYVPSTGTNRAMTPYYIEYNDFKLGEVMRIIVQKDLVLSQTKGSFIYSTTFIVSEDHYNDFYGCNLGIRTDYSNGVGRITMYKPIIFPDKYFIDINAIVKQNDNYLSCNEIIEY